MREAVIVSTARTPIGKAYRGAFNDTPGADARRPRDRRGGRPRRHRPCGEVEDVVMGAAMQQGSTGYQCGPPERLARRPAGHASPAWRWIGNAPPA